MVQTLRTTLDIGDEFDRVQRAIDRYEARLDELADRANTLDLDDDADRAEYARIQAQSQAIHQLAEDSRGYANALNRARDEWDGTEVVLRELTGLEYRQLEDRLDRERTEAGGDYVPEGIHEVRYLETCIESTPPGAPDPHEIGDLPNKLFDYLLGRAEALNTRGEVALGNFSLKERMAERASEKSSNRS